MESMKVLSLGWGVQSFTLAAMAALGEIERPDVAIHADTLHEASGTYEFARNYTPWLEERGIRVVTVKNPLGGIWPTLQKTGQTHIPAFTKATNDAVRLVPEVEWTWDENGEGFEYETGRMIEVKPRSDGQLKRSCTHRWKIVPIRRWLQANRNGRQIEQWIGISMDEYQRMKDSGVKYITNRWPLIEKRMTRVGCVAWLERHGLEVPQKSSCTFCPFHDRQTWREIKAGSSGDWAEAVQVDAAIRTMRPPFDLFLHPSRKPLPLVDFSTPEERGQYNFWNEECTGICGV